MTSLLVVTMRRRHLPEVLAIEAQVYPTPWSARLFEDELGRSGRTYMVARVGTRVVGYAGVLLIAGDGHLTTVAVDPCWQRRGMATRLLVAVVRDAVELGAHQLTLEVRMSDVGAQALYRRFGFAPAGARRAYYPEGEDALVMWAHDVASDAYAERLAVLAGGGEDVAAGVTPTVAGTSLRASERARSRASAHPSAASAWAAPR